MTYLFVYKELLLEDHRSNMMNTKTQESQLLQKKNNTGITQQWIPNFASKYGMTDVPLNRIARVF